MTKKQIRELLCEEFPGIDADLIHALVEVLDKNHLLNIAADE